MQKLLNLAVGFSLAALAIPGTAHAQVELEVVHAWGGHARFHEPIAEAFMAQNPDIEITYRAPMASYSDGHQTILRQAISDDLPDVWYSPYNTLGELVASLEPREQIQPLDDLLAEEGAEWVKANYADNVLSLGEVGGNQWGIPFNASTPIVYYNLDLIEQAGSQVPTTWDEMISTGAKVSSLSEDIDGFAYSVSEWGDDWLWQSLIFNFGGEMMNADKTEVSFGGKAGTKAVELIARIAKDTEMPLLTEGQTVEQFAAGKLGMFVGSTSEVRVMGELVGDNFEWKTGAYPIADEKGGLPVGGNAATILTTDPEKVEAAWKFVKFATGPVGQRIAVLGSGYMPTNLMTGEAEHLGDHYENNPNWTTSMRQWPVAKNWFGYPGNKGGEIWREQKTILAAIIRGEVTPEDGLSQMVDLTRNIIDE